MDALKKPVLVYQVSNTRGICPCILAMRMVFQKFREFPRYALKDKDSNLILPIHYTVFAVFCQKILFGGVHKLNVTHILHLKKRLKNRTI